MIKLAAELVAGGERPSANRRPPTADDRGAPANAAAGRHVYVNLPANWPGFAMPRVVPVMAA